MCTPNPKWHPQRRWLDFESLAAGTRTRDSDGTQWHLCALCPTSHKPQDQGQGPGAFLCVTSYKTHCALLTICFFLLL
jgi:hypothetical protein